MSRFSLQWLNSCSLLNLKNINIHHIHYYPRIMGGGFMFAGNSATARPPYIGSPGNFQTWNSVICSGIQPNGFLGPVPSRVEVERAILQLQRFMHNLPASKPELNVLRDHELEMLQSPGFNRLADAFSMMQEEPSLQNLVISISCDESVWEAIMINEAVQDLQLQASFPKAREEKVVRSPEEADISVVIMRWIMEFTKSKVLELLQVFVSIVKEIFEPGTKEKPTSQLADLLDEKVRSSFLLSVVILVIVVITRGGVNHPTI